MKFVAGPKSLRSLDTAYTYEGYAQHDSQLGSDPITAVRTMRNNMRRQKVFEKDSGRAVKVRG